MGEVEELVFNVYKGAAFRRLVETFTRANGPAYDLTTHVIRAQIRTRPGAPGAPVATFTIEWDGPTIGGKFFLFLSALTTAGIAPGNYYFDVLVDPPSGETFPLMKGRINVFATVTVP